MRSRAWLIRRGVECLWVGSIGLACVGAAFALNPVNSTRNDFFLPGTQPLMVSEPLMGANDVCIACHAGYDEADEPFTRWAASMMGQAARDPIFHACLAIAEQDAAFAGDLCLRCHAAMGWLDGRSEPTDGSALEANDFEGVSCSVCHRMVDPIYTAGVSPAVDQDILNDLEKLIGDLPLNPHTGNYIMDPLDRRRGPFVIPVAYHDWLQSPFHQSSRMCATCHDVSNPMYMDDGAGNFVLTNLDEPHPTQDKYDQFPMERTFSEWLMSAFAAGPVEMGGRFGGNRTAVSSCQDCHMPDTDGRACLPFLIGEERTDLPQHNFNGANSWVLRAVHSLYPDYQTQLTDSSVDASINRNIAMLQAASDLEVSRLGSTLSVRIVNMSGHKLPTGYVEGRRMWINVKYFNANGVLIDEHGAYDGASADLDEATTKVYEADHGLDASMAALTGKPEGPGFHFAINNKIFKDNRIPPMGFTNAGFAAVQAEPVEAVYADGQYWDDTEFQIPGGATRIEVRVYHQTTSKEYIEFLRDANVTNNAGQVAYDKWVEFGKSVPVLMDEAIIGECPADWDGNGVVNAADVGAFLSAYFSDISHKTTVTDIDGNGVVNGADVGAFLTIYFQTPPECRP